METNILADQQAYYKIIERVKLFEKGANDKIQQEYFNRPSFKAVFSPVKTISQGYYGSDALKIEFQKVSEKYPEVTDVLGDGNCFYRSFMFSFFLSLFSHESCTQIERAKRIIKLILEVEDIQFDQDTSLYAPHGRMSLHEAKDFFIMFINNQFQSDQLFSPVDFRDFYASNYFFDCSSIIICRLKILKEFKKNIFNPKLTFFLDPDKKREIPELLLRYGSQAEDVILKLSAQAFNTNLKVQSCYSQYPIIVQHEVEINPFYQQEGTVEVTLFYTGGHYMAFCDYSLKNNDIDDPIKEIEKINGQNNIPDHEEDLKLNNNIAVPIKESEYINGKKNGIPHQEENHKLNNEIAIPIKIKEIENVDGKKNDQEEEEEFINSNRNNSCDQDKNANILLEISSNKAEQQDEERIIELENSIDEDSKISDFMEFHNNQYNKLENKNEHKISKELKKDNDKVKQKTEEESIYQSSMFQSKSVIIVPSEASNIPTQQDFENQTINSFQASTISSQKACLSCSSDEKLNEFELDQNLKGYLCHRCSDAYGIVSSMKFFRIYSSSLAMDFIMHNIQ